MQLEPNPVFSIIEEQMEKMNKRTQERDQQNQNLQTQESNDDISNAKGGAANSTMQTESQSQSTKGGSVQPEYVSFVDGPNVMQMQKIAIAASFEGRATSETFDDDEQVVAYSGKRKTNKNTKGIGMKQSPKNAFFKNSTMNDMSHVWSKYRRNMHEAMQKSGDQRGKAHSLSRQDFLMQQHKFNQQLQLQMMHEKVHQYEKKLIDELAQNQLDPFKMRNSKNKDRFSKSIGRES